MTDFVKTLTKEAGVPSGHAKPHTCYNKPFGYQGVPGIAKNP